MTHGDMRLKALFAQDSPPERDPIFSAEAAGALARRRFRQDMVVVTGWTLVGTLALALLEPVLMPALQAMATGLAPVALEIGAAALLLGWMMGVLKPDLSLRT